MPNGHRPETDPDTRLTLVTLGGAALCAAQPDGELTTLLGPGKPLALLAYLVLSPGRMVSREHLADLLWADLDPDRARHALRQALWFVRKTLGDGFLASSPSEIGLSGSIPSDRDAFLLAVERGAFAAALEAYRGEFLPGFALPGGAEFEHWAEVERERLRGVFLRTAETLCRRLMDQSHAREAIGIARRMREEARLSETAWRLLIEAHLCAGDALSATIEADALETLLKTEGREPEPATRTLFSRVRNSSTTGNCPGAHAGIITELVGREREFSVLLTAWRGVQAGNGAHVHLLAGPGLGKTRLLTDFRRRLTAMGARVVMQRAWPGARSVTYGLAGELAAALGALPGAAGVSPGSARALVALHPGLSSVFDTTPDPATGAEAVRRRTAAVGELVRSVSDESPTAILLDDLHWTDQASHQLIQGALQHALESPTLLVTTGRPAPMGYLESDGTRTLMLAPLSAGNVREMLAALADLPDEDWARALPSDLHAASGGSPLLLIETLQLALEKGLLAITGQGWSAPEPDGLRRALKAGSAVRRRVEQLDPVARRILLMLSVSGARLGVPTLGLGGPAAGEEVAAALVRLEQGGFVRQTGETWQSGHDEISATALESASDAEVRGMHRVLGVELARRAVGPGDLQQAAVHLRAGGDTPRLSRTFERYCALARQSGDRRAAVQLAREFVAVDGLESDVQSLARSLPLPLRFRRGRAWLTAAALVLLAVGFLGVASLRHLPPPDGLLLVRVPSGEVWQTPLSLAAWDRNAPILPRDQGSRATGADLPPGDVDVTAGPDGSTWLISREVLDSGGKELFIRRADGSERRLTFTPGDDDMGSFSPDGRYIAFPTARWNPHGWSDIAILDLRTSGIRRITASDSYDRGPIWSPDGSRLAFVRSNLAPGRAGNDEICWVPISGGVAHCPAITELQLVSITGWLDETTLLLQHQGLTSPRMARYWIREARFEDLPGIAPLAGLSPDGRWVACYCRIRSSSDLAPYVFPVDRPPDARRILMGDLVPSAVRLIWKPTRTRPYLDTMRIEVPSGPVPVDSRYELRARGVTNLGQPADLHTVIWQSLDTGIAAVDSATGILTPRRQGTVRIVSSAGGWRADTVRVSIGPRETHTVLRESWAGATVDDWQAFGDPEPTTIPEAGESYLWTRGDSSYPSGVYTREQWDASDGLGLETRVTAVITDVHWQYVALTLTAALDARRLPKWDHRTGAPPTEPGWTGARVCDVSYPNGEGPQGPDRLSLTAAALQQTWTVPPGTRNGLPMRVRIQIFPDRRCGVAVNGRPIWISDAPIDLDQPYRAMVWGKSWHTKVLVGPLEVWTGVRRDIDWGVLDSKQSRSRGVAESSQGAP